MRRLRRVLHLDGLRDDRGMAMAMVIIFGMVIVVMVTTSLTVATSGLRKADNDQDWNGALSAAYAGIQDYQARLANDTGYTQYGNPDAQYTTKNASAGTVRLPTEANPAFGTGVSGTWATVPSSGDSAKYRYEVDNHRYLVDGTIKIRATGKVGNSVRSVTASVRQQGFIDFLYFSDYEIQDPQLSGKSATTCARYAYAGRPATGCNEIAFGSGDVIAGPAHSNDTMRICQATFSTSVTTSWKPASGKTYAAVDSNNNSCTGQQFPTGTTQPGFESSIDMPATNAQQKRETRTDLRTDVPRPGCLYTGPTDVQFTVVDGVGKMIVKSPYTRQTRWAGDDASAIASTQSTDQPCGEPGTGTGKLGSANGATVPVPDNNLIYVQNVPSAKTDQNYTSTSALPATCNQGNGVGYPLAGETAPTFASSSAPCAYGSRNGDAFVKGKLQGKLTIASENYLYATGNITYNDASSDVLGLTATNAVWVWNPVGTSTTSYDCGSYWYPRTCTSTTNGALLGDTNREIDAAVISVAHTFGVQNYDKGGLRGTLTVKGAIAQKFRGIVSSGDNGYIKKYQYDSRLKYLSPPKFLNPVTTTYGITTVGEVAAAYRADGGNR
ncbi:hypothetical protein DEJ33_01920 [Curtobacterium sp. MCPF17_047]|nr:hypothetical protein DEJ33_01920 [Curtobacterium sp. MCPF17_047]